MFCSIFDTNLAPISWTIYLAKSAFFTYYFGKLFFRLLVFYVLFVCSEFSVRCHIYIYIYVTSPAFQTSYPLKKRCSISPAFVLSHPPWNHCVGNIKLALLSKVIGTLLIFKQWNSNNRLAPKVSKFLFLFFFYPKIPLSLHVSITRNAWFASLLVFLLLHFWKFSYQVTE